MSSSAPIESPRLRAQAPRLPYNVTRALRLVAILLVGVCVFLAAQTEALRAEDPPAKQPAEPAAESAADQPASDQSAEAAPPAPSFKNEIAPIFVARCMACHGQQEPKGEYQLHNYESLMKGGASGSAMVAGQPDDTELVRLIESDDADERMPNEAEPLTADEIALVRRWVAAGAPFDGPDPKAPLASLLPARVHADPPAAYPTAVPITALAFSPDGNVLAVGGYREITLWNPTDGALLSRIKNVAERTYGLDYSPDGKLLAAASGVPGALGEVRLYNPADGSLVRHLVSLADVACDVAFSPDGTKLAAAAADRSIRVFDVATGAEEVLIEDHADWVMGIAWSPDGSKLVSASRDKTSKVFDAKTGDAVITYSGHGEPVYAAAFGPDGAQVYSAGRDRKIHQWQATDAKALAQIGGFGLDVFGVLVQAGQIFSCSADKSARQHGLEKRNEVRVFSGHNDWVYALAYHDGSKRLATGSYDGEVRVWNVADGALIAAFKAAPK
ncbi:MAG: c-type cytochrome domain-containing protein [Pirellulales bacterium]